MSQDQKTESAWGQGLASIAADGTVLDTWFRSLGWGETVPDDAPSVDAGARFAFPPLRPPAQFES